MKLFLTTDNQHNLTRHYQDVSRIKTQSILLHFNGILLSLNISDIILLCGWWWWHVNKWRRLAEKYDRRQWCTVPMLLMNCQRPSDCPRNRSAHFMPWGLLSIKVTAVKFSATVDQSWFRFFDIHWHNFQGVTQKQKNLIFRFHTLTWTVISVSERFNKMC